MYWAPKETLTLLRLRPAGVAATTWKHLAYWCFVVAAAANDGDGDGEEDVFDVSTGAQVDADDAMTSTKMFDNTTPIKRSKRYSYSVGFSQLDSPVMLL